MADENPPHIELATHIERVLGVTMPSGPGISFSAALLRRWFKPSFFGLEKLPGKPALFVGNHSLLAVDAFVFHILMHNDYRRFLRPLGDKTLFASRQYADTVIALGAALGHADVVTALMAAGQDLLLYPGGTYEAVKLPEQRYELMWKNRYGFIRLAAKMGYTIVPFAAVGPDEYFDQHLTGPEVQQAQLTQLLMQLGVLPTDLRSDIVPPLPSGVLGTPIPKPKTTFYSFCAPIDLSGFQGRNLTEKQQERIRGDVEDAIDLEIKNLLLKREQSRHKDGLLRRILSV